MEFFSKNLIYLRKKAGIKQDEAALQLGYNTRSRLANYEGGHSNPGVEDLIKLAGYYKVNIDDLLMRDISKPKKGNDHLSEKTPIDSVENEAYNRMLIESFETRIKILESLNEVLSTNNRELKTSYDNLLSMLKANHNNTTNVKPSLSAVKKRKKS